MTTTERRRYKKTKLLNGELLTLNHHVFRSVLKSPHVYKSFFHEKLEVGELSKVVVNA